MQLVLDFMRSLTLLNLSFDLGWLEELVESVGGDPDDVGEQVLDRRLDLSYQPNWLRHPTFEEVRRVLQGHEFLQSLEDYIQSVDDGVADTVSILRQIYVDIAAALSPETLRLDLWRYAIAILQHSLAWFRGTYLSDPNARDYTIVLDGESGSEPMASLYGEQSTPFPVLLLAGLTEDDAAIYRDLHLTLRSNYASVDEVRLLAPRMASLEILRQQLLSNLEELNQDA